MADEKEIKEEIKIIKPATEKPMVDDVEETDGDSKKCKNCYSFIGGLKFRNRLLDPSDPLYLPKGSIRAILTLTIISVAMICYVKSIPLNEEMWMLISTVVAFYFGSRMNYGKNKGE